MNPDQIHWEEPLAQEYLMQLGGSKSGAYAYLEDTQPELIHHLPAGTKYLAPGDDVEKFLDQIDYSKSKVVRGCHALDVFGMVDVIPTMVDVRGREAIRHAVYSLLGWVRVNKKAHSFIEYDSGQSFDRKVGILVQDFCGRRRGSIIEHPHERGIYRVGHVTPLWNSYDEDVDENICDETGYAINRWHLKKRNDRREYEEDISHRQQTTKTVIELYRKIQASGLMPSTHSFQMEFGNEDNTDEIKFYQARLFRPFQPMADFDVYSDFDIEGEFSITRPYDAFGITSPEGSEIMHRGELTKEFIHRRRGEDHVVYAHNAFGHRQTTALDVKPPNIFGFLPYQQAILEHGYYRWCQKAPLALVTMGYRIPGRTRGAEDLSKPIQKINETVRVRLFSDGFRGIIQFMEYSE